MHSLKKNNGFSLVEAIIVAVIMAILSAVAIPMYRGYITSQRQTTVDNLWETAAAAANAEYRRTGVLANDPHVDKNEAPLKLYFDDAKYIIAISGANISVTETCSSPKSKSATYR